MSAPMTIAEKILAAHAGLEEVFAGQFVECPVDLAMANDVTAPLAIACLPKLGVEQVPYPERIALVPDHYTPNKDIKSAEQAKIVRDFARSQHIEAYWEVGCVGIEHALLPEQGYTLPGQLIIGADSHTCTYGALGAFATGMGSTDLGVAFATGKAWFRVPQTIRVELVGTLAPEVTAKDVMLHLIGMIGVDGARYQVLEFAGPGVAELSVEGRMTISNMAIEAGAKAGIFPVDEATLAYVQSRARQPFTVYEADEGAAYVRTLRIDLGDVVPCVAWSHLPSNVHPVAESRHIAIDQAVIGSCTNGRIEDLRAAAEVLRGRTVAPSVRCIVIPATQAVYKQCLAEGLMDVFIDAHCAISAPTCGPCLGGHMGILAAGERAVATTNRNFVGRMGDVTSEVYLASPVVAAASAVAGHIALPSDLEEVG